MRLISIAFLFLWVMNAELIQAQNLDSVEGDRQALVDLYNATNGDNWTNNAGWLNGNPSNSWYGVQVDTNGRVISIKLNGNESINSNGVVGGNNLIGTLPETIGNLTKVTYFDVRQNKLTGEIPTSIGNMTSITHLLLNGRVSVWSPTDDHHPGKAPGGSGANERTNNFSGFIPSSIGNLTNLQYFEISGTGLEGDGLDGSIPSTIGNLTNLIGLHAGWNRFKSIPEEIGTLPNLVNLALNAQGNQTGNVDRRNDFLARSGFPQWVGGLTKLKYFWFMNNRDVGGELPSLSSIEDLRIFLVDFNGLTGTIPTEFTDGTFPNIVMVQLAWNDLTGEIPPLTGEHNLFAYTIEGNELSGEVPDSFFDRWWSLTNVHFGWNNFTGQIRQDLTKLKVIRNLQWPSNYFEGQWPELDWTNQAGLDKHPLHAFTRAEFQDNKYVFRDMLAISNDGKTLFDWYKQEADLVFNYAPQKKFGSSDDFTGSLIDFSARVSHADNVYTWSRNGTTISGETGNTIDTSSYGGGTYKLTVTNPGVPGLTLESIDIEVTDLTGSDDGSSDPEPPGTPLLLSPSDNSTDLSVSPLFEWSEVSADTYRLQVSGSSDFTNTVADFENLSGTSSQVDNLNYGSSYFWRVKAVLNGVEGDWSLPNEFSTRSEPVSIPAEPQLLSPEPGATGLSRSPSLSWSQVTDAETYSIQMSLSQTFDTLVNDLSGVGGTGVTISGLDFETEYFWRVRAVNAAGAGGWSETRSFTTLDEPLAEPGVPVLVSPAAGATDVSRSPLLNWDVAANAATYNLQVSTSQAFETLETDITDIFESEFSVSGLDFETIYYWRVKAINETGESDWSQIRLFTTLDEPLSAPSSPGLLLPEANSTEVSRSPELSWSTPVDAETYRVQVSATSGFGSPVVDLDNVSESGIVAENLNYSTTYFWRVLAANDAGQSSWSEIRSFTTREQPLLPPPAPQLVSPQSGSEEISSINHTFTWNETEGAESYRLQFSVGNNSFSPSIDIENINDISRTVEGLEPETTYLWRVQAANGAGSSDWSEIWFFVTDEAAPLPSLPLANSTNVELAPSFTWNSLNADEYILQVNRANTGETVVEESVADTTFTVSSELSPLTVYRWRVKAVSDSLEGEWGPSIAFTTGNPDGDSGNDDDNGDEDDGNDGDDGLGDNRDEEITTIEQNYPNPFNPSTVIQFRLAEAQQVSLKIYNLAGQRVATLVSEPLSAGTHSRVFDAAGLASGIYFYRLITERNVFTKKMTLIK